jgi:hypothetical protein
VANDILDDRYDLLLLPDRFDCEASASSSRRSNPRLAGEEKPRLHTAAELAADPGSPVSEEDEAKFCNMTRTLSPSLIRMGGGVCGVPRVQRGGHQTPVRPRAPAQFERKASR